MVRAFWGHMSRQVRHPMQRDPIQWIWGWGEMLSGLWHQVHLRLQPLKKTVVLKPGPSSVDMRWISRMRALFFIVVVARFIVIVFSALNHSKKDSRIRGPEGTREPMNIERPTSNAESLRSHLIYKMDGIPYSMLDVLFMYFRPIIPIHLIHEIREIRVKKNQNAS